MKLPMTTRATKQEKQANHHQKPRSPTLSVIYDTTRILDLCCSQTRARYGTHTCEPSSLLTGDLAEGLTGGLTEGLTGGLAEGLRPRNGIQA